MSEKHKFQAFIAALVVLVILFLAACLLAYHGRSVEALGISGVMTGIITLLGALVGTKQQTDEVKVMNRPNEPVPTEPQQ